MNTHGAHATHPSKDMRAEIPVKYPHWATPRLHCSGSAGGDHHNTTELLGRLTHQPGSKRTPGAGLAACSGVNRHGVCGCLSVRRRWPHPIDNVLLPLLCTQALSSSLLCFRGPSFYLESSRNIVDHASIPAPSAVRGRREERYTEDEGEQRAHVNAR